MALLAVTRSVPDTDTTEPWLSVLLRMPPGQLAFPTAGLVVSLRRPASPIGWLLSGVGLVLCVNEFMRLYGEYALHTAPGVLPGGLLVGWAATWSYAITFVVFPWIVLLFPSGRLVSHRWRPLACTTVGLGALILVLAALRAGPLEYYPDIDNPLGVPLVTTPFVRALGAFYFVLFLACTASLVVRLRRAAGEERQQVKWVAAAALLTGVELVVGPFLLPEIIHAHVGTLTTVVLAGAIAVAVLRHRLVDIDRVISRSVLYAALTAAVIGIYLLIASLSVTVLGSARVVPAAVAAAVVAVGLTPADEWLRQLVGRWQGDRADPALAIAHLGDRISETDEPAQLTAVLGELRRATGATGVAVAAPDGHLVAADGTIGRAHETIALQIGGTGVGALTVAGPDPPAAGVDRQVVAALAPVVAVVVLASVRAGELAAARDRAVRVTRAERQRLRRDLHDGLGPSLAGIALCLRAAGDQIGEAYVRRVLERSGDDATAAVHEVRRLLDELALPSSTASPARAGEPQADPVQPPPVAWTDRVLTWSVAAAAVAAAAATIGLWSRPGGIGPGSASTLFQGLAGVAVSVTGAVLLTLRPRNAVARLLLLAGACTALAPVFSAYSWRGAMLADPEWPAARWAGLVATGLWIPGFVPLTTMLVGLYPDGRLPHRWQRWPVWGAGIATIILAAVMPLLPSAYDDILPGPAPLSLPEPPLIVFLLGVPLPLLVGSALAIWVGSILRLVRAGPPERQQLAWLICFLVPATLAAFFAPQWVSPFLALFIPVGVAVGVLRYRLLGIELLIRRGLVYGVLTAALVGVYLTATVGGSLAGRARVPAVGAAVLIAVGLTPLRIRLQRAIDRLVYGHRADPVAAVRHFGGRVATTGEPELLPWALSSVAASTGARGAEVRGPDGAPIAAVGAQPSRMEIGTLRYGGNDLGTLWLSTWYPAPRLRPRGEAHLHRALAAQVAVVLKAAQATAELIAERDRLIAAVAVERERLRDDLRGGLAPLLAGIGLGLQAVSVSGPAAALVGRARDEAVTALREVWQIVDDLRPAPLGTGNLVDAIKGTADALAGVTVDLRCGPLPALPVQVEDAAYRITAEALTNAAKHADARRVRVTLAAPQQTLLITVADDGRGLRPRQAGVGIASMRERARKLGGRVEITSRQTGTTVTATLPFPLSTEET
jgi:signal transduction histidine kinase